MQILQRPRQSVHSLGKNRIRGNRFPVRGDSLFQLPIAHQVERSIVVILGLLAGVCVGHGRNSLAETGF